MQSLFRQILASNKNKGLTTVDKLLENSGLISAVKQKLTYEGYNVSGLSDRGVAILFFSLVDLLFIVKNDNFQIVTMSNSKVIDLNNEHRIVPRDDDVNFNKTSQIIQGNSLDVINQYLQQKKFHFIKLNVLELYKYKNFYASVSTMNPYPTLESEDVYCSEDVMIWHNELNNLLIKGCYKLTTKKGDFICQNFLSKPLSICMSGELIAKDMSNTCVSYKLWDILDIKPHASKGELEQALLQGVVKYDNKYITLNRGILENFYGKKLYTNLESIGVRRKYCLEELLSTNSKLSVAYYVNKYNLEIFDCSDIAQLEKRLMELIDKSEFKKDCIYARVLGPYESISRGYQSFYLTINLNGLQNHSVELVKDINSVLPREYTYFAISKDFGYTSTTIKATSDSMAMKLGKQEFERKFGSEVYFCALKGINGWIKGSHEFKLSLSGQKNLCQSVMYGYTDNFKGYAKQIKELCRKNDITGVEDEHIKLLFANQLARKYKYGSDVKLADCSLTLLNFMSLYLIDGQVEKSMNSEYMNIAIRRVTKEYPKIAALHPYYEGFFVNDEVDGKYIRTENGKYKIGKDGLNKKVELFYNDKSLGVKIIG